MPSQTIGDVRLLVSELLTNPVRHAGLGASDRIRFVVAASTRVVRVEVSHPGPDFEAPSLPIPRPDQTRG